MDETDAGCDIKLSDFQGFFDLAFQILGSTEFSWDDFLEALLTFPTFDEETKASIRTAIEYIQEDPFLLELSKQTVDEYLATHGDISLCELVELENGGGDTSTATPQDLTGGDAAEIFLAGLGNDTVDAGAGNDVVNGGAGDDFLFGGFGSDLILGGLGNDKLYADTLDQLAAIGNGIINKLWAGLGADSLFGGAAVDFLGGGAGDDFISAGAGDDILFGGKGTDQESGGNDNLSADDGDDISYAGDGNDTVDGGTGDDTLTGSEGTDSFLFVTNSGADTITDFETGVDLLDLSSTSFDFTDIADVQARATETADGLVIDLGDNATLTLTGLTSTDISDINFAF